MNIIFLFGGWFLIVFIYNVFSGNTKKENTDKQDKERQIENRERRNDLLDAKLKNIENLKSELNEKIKHIKFLEYENEQLSTEIQNTVSEYEATIKNLKSELSVENREVKEKIRKELWENCKKYMEDKSVSMPWLAAGMADFMTLQEEAIIQTLQLGNHRDWERSIKINDLKKEKKALIAENKLLRYQIAYFKRIVPEIEELDDFDYIPVHYDTENDAVKAYLSDDEYNELSETEKNQLALERYWKRKKSKWEIGRDFERYYGYLLEQRGYKVTYFGIDKGFEDMGRDLIAENAKHILIIQCKYWSKNKKIHEKHICQLLGSATEYKIAFHPQKEVIPLFVTHTRITETAKEFAHELKIAVRENVDLQEYPVIKCNVATGIYHLPMDQHYDNFEVKPEREDCYVMTVQEAEELGCRRAWKWHKK